MKPLFEQIDPSTLPVPHSASDLKPWIIGIGALLVLMILGRFVQAFKNGAGLIDAAKAVIFGTNMPSSQTQRGPVNNDPTAIANKMTLLLIVTGLLALPLALTACRTTANPSGVVTIAGQTIDPVVAGHTAQLAAKYGSLELLRQKPQSAQYLSLASAGVLAVVASGNYNPTNLQAALTITGASPVELSATADAVQIYTDFFGQLVAAKLDAQSPYTVPVLTGIATGIQQALLIQP